jgi:hypothetical protein
MIMDLGGASSINLVDIGTCSVSLRAEIEDEGVSV